jgi:RNA polymerase sigma factor (sigma-70 family)
LSTVELVRRAKGGDLSAFTSLVKNHQNLALGYAYSQLGDFHLAQDVVQDSFLIASKKLDQLESLESFAGWLRGIVHHRCHRVFRMNLRKWQELDEELIGGEDQNLEGQTQKAQERDLLLAAIQDLSEKHRQVVTLYYLEEESQEAVASFLGIPTSKVNNYLYEARQNLKGRLFDMAKDTFKEKRLSENFANNIGEIICIQGHLVETKIKGEDQPRIFDVLGSKKSASEKGDDLVVIQRLEKGKYRCIATGTSVKENAALYVSENSDRALKALTEERIREAVKHIRSASAPSILETGIKVVDLFCPIPSGGAIGIFGREGVGRSVLVMELLHRRKNLPGELSLFFYVNEWNLLGTQDMLDTEKLFAHDKNQNIQTAWMVHPLAGDPEYVKAADYLDVRLYFSPFKAAQGIWPALDPLHSYSTALDQKIVGEEHFRVATEALQVLRKGNELMRDSEYLELMALGSRAAAKIRLEQYTAEKLKQASSTDRETILRAQRIERFMSQPFETAAEVTGVPGVVVSLRDTISGVQRILNGDFDSTDLKSLSFKGSI